MESFWNNIPAEYVPFVNKFTKTSEFQEVAQFFRDNECYTFYIEDTIQFNQFWDEQYRRCIEGYTNSVGISIPGSYYFYLNFVQIPKQEDPYKIEKGKKKNPRKIEDFPRFVDIDYIAFWLWEYCRNTEEPKSFVCSKGRRGGWSLKAASEATREFNFFKKSSTLIGGYLSTYSEGTMKMVITNCNFLNKYTEFGRPRNPDTLDEIKARHQVTVDGRKTWEGIDSVVECVTFLNRPGAAVGRTASLLILDEAGVFNNIIETYGLTEPIIKDGSDYTGMCLMFGSSDTMGFGSLHLKKIFTSPHSYNMLEFPIPKARESENKIGFFSPAYMGRWGKCTDPESNWYKKPMVDEDGNSNIDAAIDDLMYGRKVAKKGEDPKKYKDLCSQFPIEWEEAFRVVINSPLPTYLAEETLADLETTPSLNTGRAIKLVYKEGKLDFEDNPVPAIFNFPLSQYDNNTGSIEIWEHPYTEVPNWGIYLAGIDPYDKNSADNSSSLGSMIVMHSLTNKIVAEYTGRPSTAKEYYENCLRLAKYYNCLTLYENNLMGLFTYFDQMKVTYLLADTPQILRDVQILKTTYTSGSQSKGYTATKESIKYGLELIKTYMLEPYTGQDDTTKTMTMTHTIKSKPLLKEMIYWHPELNVDRLKALAALLILKEDRYKILPNEDISSNNEELHPFLKGVFGKLEIPTNSYKQLPFSSR